MTTTFYRNRSEFIWTSSDRGKNIYKNFVIDLYLNSKQDAETISEILLRAASEPEFRNQLIKEPAQVLEQFNISDEARSIIKTSINDLSQ